MYSFTNDQNKIYNLIIENEGISSEQIMKELNITSYSLFTETMWHLEFYGKVYETETGWELY